MIPLSLLSEHTWVFLWKLVLVGVPVLKGPCVFAQPFPRHHDMLHLCCVMCEGWGRIHAKFDFFYFCFFCLFVFANQGEYFSPGWMAEGRGGGGRHQVSVPPFQVQPCQYYLLSMVKYHNQKQLVEEFVLADCVKELRVHHGRKHGSQQLEYGRSRKPRASIFNSKHKTASKLEVG